MKIRTELNRSSHGAATQSDENSCFYFVVVSDYSTPIRKLLEHTLLSLLVALLRFAYGVGASPAATQAVMHAPSWTLQAMAATGAPIPPVTVPNTNPPAA